MINQSTFRYPWKFLILSLLLLTQLSGCSALILGGAAIGVNVIHDRRSTGAYVDDKEILLAAMNLRSKNKTLSEKSDVDITVYNQRILLTGQAQNAELARQFAQQVAGIPRVRQVLNEVETASQASWSDDASDTFLTSRVRFALFDVEIAGFDPTRVLVTSSLGSVYLMGLLTEEEASAVTETVRHVSGVKRVVRLFEDFEPDIQ